MFTIPKLNYALSFTFSLIVFLAGCSKSGDNLGIVTPPTDTTTHVPAKAWVVSTFAGSGKAGNVDGADSVAEFNDPEYIALDKSGNVVVSDVMNFLIKKIKGGKVTSYAGAGISNPDPQFGNIFGFVLDDDDNIFDIEYSMIRKISSPTKSAVFAGGLEVNFRDGQDTAARFTEINKIARDKNGNFYVPDYDRQFNFKIRKITPGGLVSTLTLNDNTGIASGSNGSIIYLSPIAVDEAGNIYFTSNGNSLIKKADPSGNVSVFAGALNVGFKDGKGSDALFGSIRSIVVDKFGNLYVVDSNNNAIRKITTDGTVVTIAGSPQGGYADGDGAQAKFVYPSDVAVDNNGVIYVADAGNNRIRKIEYK